MLLFVPLVKSGGRQSQGENYDDDAAKTLLQPNFFVSWIEFGSIDPNGRLFMCDSMHETAATPSVPLATVAMCVRVFSKTMYLDRQRYTVLWPYLVYDFPTQL